MQDDAPIRPSEDPDRIVVWRPAAPPRPIEGPLPVDCFEDRILVLELAPAQLACRAEDGGLKQVFLDGVHRLEIGRMAGQTTPESRFTFLRPDVPMDLRWRRGDCLVLDTAREGSRSCRGTMPTGPEQGLRLPLRGSCRLILADPILFYCSILQGLDQPQHQDLTAVLDALVRSQLAEHLHPLLRGRDLNHLHAQTLLGGLGPSDLGEDLAEIGLDCLHLAAYLPLEHERPCEPSPAVPVPPGSYDDLL